MGDVGKPFGEFPLPKRLCCYYSLSFSEWRATKWNFVKIFETRGHQTKGDPVMHEMPENIVFPLQNCVYYALRKINRNISFKRETRVMERSHRFHVIQKKNFSDGINTNYVLRIPFDVLKYGRRKKINKQNVGCTVVFVFKTNSCAVPFSLLLMSS